MSSSSANVPRVAVAVFLRRSGKILLGKRKGERGNGKWAIPGGRIEFGEAMTDAAKREIHEETGYTITDLVLATVGEELFEDENVHYVTVFFVADAPADEPKLMEPEKCERWEWFSWDELPTPMLKVYDGIIASGFNPLVV